MKRICVFALLLFSLSVFAKQDNGESGIILSGTGGRTIVANSATCTASSSTATTNCTAAAASSFGDLFLIISKTASTSSSATMAVTFIGTTPCTPNQAIAPANTFQTNGGGHFVVSVKACLVTTATTIHPVVTWTGGSGSFTDISVLTYTANFTWNSGVADQTAISLNNTASTSCATGTTATTTGAFELVLAICENFNVGQTWNTLSGFTNRTANERNTLGWYDKVVTSTGTQTASIPLSSSDVSVGMIVTYKSN